METATLEAGIQEVGRDLAAGLGHGSRGPLRALDDRAMDFAAQDEQLKAALFRFVDVVPACRSLDDLARHLTDRKSTRLNSSHIQKSRMPSSA